MRIQTALFIAVSATIISGAKPAPPPSTADPQIAYVNISGGARRLYQLRLANEDGTGASTIYSSRDVGQMVPHMGPRADRTILLVQGSQLSLVRYEPTSTGTKLSSIEPLPPIGTAPGAQEVAFSPDGKKFVSFAQNDKTFWVFDMVTRVFSPLLTLAATPNSFAFSREGSSLLYLDHVSDTDAILKSVPLSGGAPTELGVRGNFWDVEPAHQSDAYVLVRGVDLKTSRVEYRPAGGGASVDLAQGYAPSLKCDDSTLIYQQVQPDSSVRLLRVNVSTKAGYTTSTSGNYWPDFVGC
jgi:WD40 repeat protein